jgi:RNA polymerase sigma-70 factor (ECF subfamily)
MTPVEMIDGLVLPESERMAVLYRDHGRALRAFIGARVRDRGAVEDLCQDTFLAALAGGVPREGAGRWLFAIARNKVLKHLRDRKPPVEGPGERPGSEPGPDDRLDHEEAVRAVRAQVDGLEEELREVIQLRYEGGLNYRQIADYLDLPHPTVQGRLKRAREALRRGLGPLLEQEGATC